MKTRILWWLACVAVVCSSTSALAIDWGIGLEGAGTLSLARSLPSGNAMSTSAGAGIILEERLSLAIIELTLWEDAQLPYTLNISTSDLGGATSAQFIPIDAGLRLGFALGIVRPYLGILGNYNIANSEQASGGSYGAQNFWGLGGDLGLDIAVIFLRFGLDLRAFWSVSDVTTGAPDLPGITTTGGGLMLQGLLSARFSF
ncbi:MAG TPA: hypothetical protein VMB50_10355 [Myxococcales bacterium]|nr:hypothetical protein [Myxococcales bacterium]